VSGTDHEGTKNTKEPRAEALHQAPGDQMTGTTEKHGLEEDMARAELESIQRGGVLTEEGVGAGTFDAVRDHLARQFEEPWFDAATGIPVDVLRAEVEDHLSKMEGAPRVLQKAEAYRLIVTRGQIAVDPQDWFVDKLNHGGILRALQRRWYREAQEGAIREEADWFRLSTSVGAVRGGLDMGHISPGWEKMFGSGLSGLVDEARRMRDRVGSGLTAQQDAFYEAVETVHEATIGLAERFSDLALRMAIDQPEHGPRLRAVSSVCDRVPADAPTSFHEALQFAWTMHELIEMEGENVRSMGHFDRTLYPYYRDDLDTGRLTREEAKELIKFFWFKHFAHTQGNRNGKNFVFGGQDADGKPVENDLTYLALEAYDELNVPDPKLSVRFAPGTSNKLIRRVGDLIRRGRNSFVLMNDVPAVDGLVAMGKPVEDARTYLPIGCYEPAVDGKEAGCTMNLVVSLAKAVELALNDGMDPQTDRQVGPKTGDPRNFGTFDNLLDAYNRQIEFLIQHSVACVGSHEQEWPNINPSPLIAATIDDCLSRGKDIGEGGPHYNSVGCVGAGLANACDSLMGMKQAVYDDKQFEMDDILEALLGNFEGTETMRLYLLNRVPKWGNSDPDSDALGVRIAHHFCDTAHALRNARGGRVQAALFTLTHRLTMGKATGALPDGRRSGESLAPGAGSTLGQDRRGVTGLLGSASKIDYVQTPNGSVLDVTIHPTAVAGEEGLDAFEALVSTYFDQGGYALQFNVFDTDTLRDAQKYPDRYQSLQIRVTGWSVYFNALSKHEQDQIIERHALGA
jgi:pyruvate-formate lyase